MNGRCWPTRNKGHTNNGARAFKDIIPGNMAPRARLPWAGGLHCFAKQCKRKAVQIDVSHNLISGLRTVELYISSRANLRAREYTKVLTVLPISQNYIVEDSCRI